MAQTLLGHGDARGNRLEARSVLARQRGDMERDAAALLARGTRRRPKSELTVTGEGGNPGVLQSLVNYGLDSTYVPLVGSRNGSAYLRQE